MKVSDKDEKVNIISQDEIREFQGKHILLELYNCDALKLNDESYLRCAIDHASKFAKATVLNLVSYKFQPHGVTAIALLAESHLSIHTWPESGYAAVDIFTCGKNMSPELACEYLIDSLEAKSHYLRKIKRKSPEPIKNQVRNSF